MVGLDYNYIDETGAKTSLDDVASNYELSKSQKEYLTELNVSPEEFKEMSDGQKEDLCHDIRDRLEEIEVYSVMAQDKAIKDTCCSEILGEFRQQVFKEKLNQLNDLEKATPLSIEVLKLECPELYNQVQRMNSRLGNNNPDGIMNTMQYALLENGDFVAYNNIKAYSNSRMVYS